MDSILEDILTEARAYGVNNRRFLAVFDLDSTLLDLTNRVLRICEIFAKDFRDQFPEECRQIAKLDIQPRDWGIREGLERLGISEAKNTKFWKAIHDHWTDLFFSNDHLHHDEPLLGAVDYVLELRKEGAHIMYLTGRDVPRMYEGTARSLEAFGFPLDPVDARLVLKPDAKLHDAPFKVDVLKSAAKTYDRIWLFENEPVNTNLVAKECPEVGIVFIDSTHSGREEVAANLVQIPNFDSWTRKVKA